MFRLEEFRPILAVLASVLLLGIALGALAPLVGVQLSMRGASAAFVGAVSSAYFAGFLIGTLFCHRVIERVGHIRAYAVFAVVAANVALVHGMHFNESLWLLLRVATGYAVAGMFVVVESWLNDKATPQNRGRVFAAYGVAGWGAAAIGPIGLNLPSADGRILFEICTIFMATSLLPIAFTRTGNPPLPERRSFSMRRLVRASPLGVFACFASGLTNATLYGLLPAYTSARGFDARDLSLLIVTGTLGGLLAQYPIGAAADRLGRRPMMLGVCLAGALLAGGGMTLLTGGLAPLLVLVFLLAALLAPMYALGVGQVGDYIEREDFVAASGRLLFAWGVGACIGPLVAGLLMKAVGPAGLFLFICGVLGSTAAFIVVRMLRRRAMPAAEQGDFVPLPPTESVQVSLDLDPRAEPTTESAVPPSESAAAGGVGANR